MVAVLLKYITFIKGNSFIYPINFKEAKYNLSPTDLCMTHATLTNFSTKSKLSD